MKRVYKESELILNPDGSVYHIKLKPEHIAQKVIVVGDQGRVEVVSKHFDKIEHKIQNREFLTHTGYFNGKRITVMSTGIGTDNIDIAINELDAAVNIDLEKRVTKETLTSLDIIRIGTSGALQADIDVDSFVASTHGLGFDGLLNFYKFNDGILEDDISKAFVEYAKWGSNLPYPYVAKGSEELKNKIAHDLKSGITATASGFFGPQGRELRIPLGVPDLNEKIEQFNYNGHRITNFEMETSALYGLGKILGHNTLTVCAIIANRLAKTYSKDYKKSIEKLVELVLERFSAY
jgi:uridine phosphorylase